MYVINKIQDLTNIYDIHFFPDIQLKKKSLVDGILKIFGSHAGTMTHLIQFYRR